MLESTSTDYLAVAQFGRALHLGCRGRRFKSCQLDMAKFDEGDEVRLKKQISSGTIHVSPNTKGKITRVTGKWGSKRYHVRFQGMNFDIQVEGNRIDPLSAGEGW